MLRRSFHIFPFISGPSGPGRGGYDPSLGRPRLSSDTSWERPERRSDSSNWRAGGEEEEGWRISGQRSDRWRGTWKSACCYNYKGASTMTTATPWMTAGKKLT